MGHFVKNKKSFNAYIDRLINLNFDEFNEVESEEQPSEDTNLMQTSNSNKLDKLH